MNDNKAFTKHYLDTILFPIPKTKKNRYINRDSLELIIRKECNQQCEYCYIYKHGKELYPNTLSNEETLHNVDLLLDYVYNTRRNWFYDMELFAGDLFYDDIYFDVMELIEKYFKQVKLEEPNLFKMKTKIMMPCNFNFAYEHPEKLEKIKTLCKRFWENYHTELNFSWSTDGLYGEPNREKSNYTEEYFDTLFERLSGISVGLHPMTYANNIEVMKESYDWWLEKIKKYFLPKNPNQDFQPMMLEVRNGEEWSDEKIESYKDFLTHVFNTRLKMNNDSIEEMAYHIFGNSRQQLKDKGILPACRNYDIILLPKISEEERPEEKKRERSSCAIQGMIHLNATNLSIVLCHRLAYKVFTSLYFIVNEENTKIIDFRENNIDALITVKTLKEQNFPGCSVCKFGKICLKGCLGAQFEQNSDVFLPIPSVCKLFKSKFKHLVTLYKNSGVLDKALELDLIQDYTYRYYMELLEENIDV